MNIADIQALSELIQPEEDDEFSQNTYQKGSVFAPSDIGSSGQKKEIAKPFAQIEIKVGNQQPQQEQAPQQKQEKQKRVPNKNDIWDIEEVQIQSRPTQDNRLRPDVDVLYKQIVGTGDVFGGWQGLDPSSTKCQGLLIRIKLPQTRLAEINLEILKQQILLSSTKYYLNYVLPYPINETTGKAKFISDKEILEIELQIIREELY